jgi:hypothetical protein
MVERNCSLCGEEIVLTSEQKELITEGFIHYPTLCNECAEINGQTAQEEPGSDADIGL